MSQHVGGRLNIMKRKIKIIVDGIFIPFIVFVGITLIITFAYVMLSIVMRMLSGEIIDFTDANNISGNINAVLVQGIADIFVIPVLVLLYRKFKNNYELCTGLFNLREFLYVIPIAFSVCVICNILIGFLPIPEVNAVSKEIFELINQYNIFVSLFIVSILVPIVEELLFRAFFYDSINLLSNHIVAIIMTSILFGLIHFNIEQGIYGFVAGLFLGYIKYKYNRLSYTIFMHLFMNFSSIVFIPSMALFNIREQLYVVFICLAILIFTLYRMNMGNKKEI